MYQEASHEFSAGNDGYDFQGYGHRQDSNLCISAVISASCAVMDDQLPGSHMQQLQQQQQQQQQQVHPHPQDQPLQPYQLQADDHQDMYLHHGFSAQGVPNGNVPSFQMDVSGSVYTDPCQFDPSQSNAFVPPAGAMYDDCPPFDFNLSNDPQGCCPNPVAWQQGSDGLAEEEQAHHPPSAALETGVEAECSHSNQCHGNSCAAANGNAPAMYHEMKTSATMQSDSSCWSPEDSSANSAVDVDYMISNGVTVAGFKPRALIRKRKKSNVPENTKRTETYKERRKKNNDSARRSREAKKEKERNFYKRALELEYENYYLKQRITWLESQLALVNPSCT